MNFSVKKNVYYNNLTRLIAVNLLVTLDLLLLLIPYLLNTMVALVLGILNKCYFDTLKNYFVYFNTPFYNRDFLQLRGNACSLNFLIVEKYEKLI